MPGESLAVCRYSQVIVPIEAPRQGDILKMVYLLDTLEISRPKKRNFIKIVKLYKVQ